jgi:3-methylcrotonyl-CoA carboxylase alpha subunit
MEIHSVLIANRGEIAVRIMRTLKRMNIKSVALYTDIESDDLHVKTADEKYFLGTGSIEQTWLNTARIIKIARQHQVDAIHPGYGFLSENAGFAKACEQAGIIFIGPRSEVIKNMGSKIVSAAFATQAGLPLLPRMEGNHEFLIRNGSKIGYPILVKAAAGGGGKGMVKVENALLLEQAVSTTAAQAKRYFSDDAVYLEKYIQNPRHIEVQILADHHGEIIHLYERECTLQRNHQKVIEEAPATSIDHLIRDQLVESALKLAREVGYTNAGTIEFILDEKMNFYFLEMNTRIQVEHPVSEMITGLDLIEQQIRIARGEKLGFTQSQIQVKGHAIEARLYAEDPARDFIPSPGFVKALVTPPACRVDSAINGSGLVHSCFDPMIAKIIVHEQNREKAIAQLNYSLKNTLIHGIKSNISLLRNIARDPAFSKNDISTHSIVDNRVKWSVETYEKDSIPAVAALFIWLEKFRQGQGWRLAADTIITINGIEHTIYYYPAGDKAINILVNDRHYYFENIMYVDRKITAQCNNATYSFVCSVSWGDVLLQGEEGSYHVVMPETIPLPKVQVNGHETKIVNLKASIFGKVLRINVSDNQKVNMGDPLIVIESMKMENTILAPGDSTVSKVNVKEGDQIIDGQSLIYFEP